MNPTGNPRRWRLLVAPAVVALLLLAGCQSTPTDDLEDELAGIAGVELIDIDATRVKATLVDDVSAADAQTAILAVRDRSIAAHPLGADVELVVVIGAGARDFGDPQPWEVYSYGRWSAGATGGEGFAQQAAFFASLADWETLTTTPAQIRRVQFAVTGVDSVVETPAPGDTAAPAETAAPEDGAEAEAPTVQVVDLLLGQSFPNENLPTDVDALIAELEALWVASGGDPAGITIR
jgi:hypothetical protein